MLNSNKIVLDANNIETGLWLPEDYRYYVDEYRYVNKYSTLGLALKASRTILNT